jgi:hypothetical protein
LDIGKAGAYYVAFGGQSRKCLKEIAIPAFRRFCPGIPIAVASDRPIGTEDIFVKLPDKDIGGRMAKLSVYSATPKDWKYVLYMDADTEVKKDISFLFQIVEDGWDLAICRHWGKHDFRRFRNNDNLDEFDRSITEIGTDCSMAYQGGMFVFKRGVKVGRFFKMWLKEWKRWGKRDQAAFVRALNKVPLKIYLLPSCWNQRQNKQDTVIYHYQHIARRYAHDYFKKIDRLDSEDAWKGIR